MTHLSWFLSLPLKRSFSILNTFQIVNSGLQEGERGGSFFPKSKLVPDNILLDYCIILMETKKITNIAGKEGNSFFILVHYALILSNLRSR